MNEASRVPRTKTWRDTTGRGDIAEFAVLLALVRDGKKVLRPISSATRYDLAVDNEDGTLTRIQCKTGRSRHGRVEFRLYSMSGHTTQRKSYGGDVDAFGVFCQETGATYLIPVGALGGNAAAAYLRVVPARNGQIRRTRRATDYAIGVGITLFIPLPPSRAGPTR